MRLDAIAKGVKVEGVDHGEPTQSHHRLGGGESLGGFQESGMLGVEVIFRVLKIFFFFLRHFTVM